MLPPSSAPPCTPQDVTWVSLKVIPPDNLLILVRLFDESIAKIFLGRFPKLDFWRRKNWTCLSRLILTSAGGKSNYRRRKIPLWVIKQKRGTMLQTWYSSSEDNKVKSIHLRCGDGEKQRVWRTCIRSESRCCCLTWSKWAELFSGFPSVICLSGRRKNSAAVGKPGRTVTRSWSSLTPVAWRRTVEWMGSDWTAAVGSQKWNLDDKYKKALTVNVRSHIFGPSSTRI